MSTCADAQARADSVQRCCVALAGDSLKAVLLGPLPAHMVRRLEGRLPVHPGASAQGGSSQDVDACAAQSYSDLHNTSNNDSQC